MRTIRPISMTQQEGWRGPSSSGSDSSSLLLFSFLFDEKACVHYPKSVVEKNKLMFFAARLFLCGDLEIVRAVVFVARPVEEQYPPIRNKTADREKSSCCFPERIVMMTSSAIIQRWISPHPFSFLSFSLSACTAYHVYLCSMLSSATRTRTTTRKIRGRNGQKTAQKWCVCVD